MLDTWLKTLYSFELPASPRHGQFLLAKFWCKLWCHPYGRVRLARVSRVRLLRYAEPILMKKNNNKNEKKKKKKKKKKKGKAFYALNA